MADLSGFDAEAVEPSKGFDLLPADTYQAVIVESEMKAAQSGSGDYLSLTFEIIEGDHKGRKLWTNLNLYHKTSEQAVSIARGELSAICRAVGVPKPGDSAELHDRPMSIIVGITIRKDTGDRVNKIKGYKPAGSAGAPVAAGGKPPWQK